MRYCVNHETAVCSVEVCGEQAACILLKSFCPVAELLALFLLRAVEGCHRLAVGRDGLFRESQQPQRMSPVEAILPRGFLLVDELARRATFR